MIRLETNDYSKLNILLENAAINTLFAWAVIEQKVKGVVYVDNADVPRTCYIHHPYGMSLLAGNSNITGFNQRFKEYALNIRQERTKEEWIQAYPDTWDKVLRDLFVDNEAIIEYDTRINFRFNKTKFCRESSHTDKDIHIQKTTKDDFAAMKGTVIPAHFWDKANDFETEGQGYSLYYKHKLAAIAFASFVKENILELGIETVEAYRGKHFAYKVCTELIGFCLENNLEPFWSCRLSNTASYKLAEKLGFEVYKENPYYQLRLS